jgi:hypothetical protein
MAKLAATIAASVSRVVWQPPFSRGHSVASSARCSSARRRARRDVLVEAQLAARADHARQLAQRARRIGHAAQHPGHYATVHRRVVGGQPVGEAVDDAHRDRGAACSVLRHRAQMGLGLDGEQLGDGGGVVGEAHAAAGADLDHAPAQIGQQPAAVLGAAAALLEPGGASEQAGEDRAAGDGRCHRSYSMAKTWGVP